MPSISPSYKDRLIAFGAGELGIPCVNGIPRATERLHDGDLVTIDGHLGIVTVGAAEFELEQAIHSAAEERED